jgi:hypothetical protein
MTRRYFPEPTVATANQMPRGGPTETTHPYAVVVGAFASPSSSPRFLARNAETFALFMHRSEQ